MNKIFTGTPNFFSELESPTQTFCLVPNVTIVQERVPRYPQPCNLVFHLPLIAKRCARDNVAQLWSRDSEIISPYILQVVLTLTKSCMSVSNYQQTHGFLVDCFCSMLTMYKQRFLNILDTGHEIRKLKALYSR